LLGEGQARYNEGLRHSYKEQWKAFFRTFYFSFKGLKGYKDGLTGLIISFMEARYEFLSWAGLKSYQRRQEQ
jgi:hypothetical protein